MPIDENVKPEDRDAALRMRDAVNLHVHVIRHGGLRDRPGFVAIKFEDGRSPDGILYDSRRDCMRHHRNRTDVFPVKVGHDTMGEREALVVLLYNRQAREKGVIFSEEEIVQPHRLELLGRAHDRILLEGDPE